MRRHKNYLATIIIVLFLAAIVIPVVTMCMWTFTERWAWPDLLPQVFSTRAYEEIANRKGEMFRVFLSSIGISMMVAVLSTVIGIMTSRAFVFYDFKGKKLLYFTSILPFLVPATVFAMGIQTTFIKFGLSNTVIGVIVVHVICSLPYATHLLMEGTKAVGNQLEEQARLFGAGPFTAFRKVTLPLLTPVILSALSMSYIVSFSQYFLTLLIGGGGVKTFTIVMVPYLQSGERNIACVYSILFLSVTLVVFGIFEWMIGRWTNNNKTEFYT